MMETESFGRLLSEQTSGVDFTEGEIFKLMKFKHDYLSVISRINELSKSVSKSAYLPFGKRAFVPGLLVHTNELLVYLGGSGDYFTELSTYETEQLLQRRITNLDDKINVLKQQKELLVNRMKFTKDLSSKKSIFVPNTSSRNYVPKERLSDVEEVEIREEYDPATEADWKVRHALSRKKERIRMAACEYDITNFGDIISPSNSASSSNESSTDTAESPVIHFKHSDVPSCTVRQNVVDVSTLTVAEAINLSLRDSGLMQHPKTAIEPFGEIMQCSSNTSRLDSENQVTSVESRPHSKFRSRRMENKTKACVNVDQQSVFS